MLSEEQARYREAYEQRMSQPMSGSDQMLMSLFMLGVLGLLVVGAGAPLWGLWKWRGGAGRRAASRGTRTAARALRPARACARARAARRRSSAR